MDALKISLRVGGIVVAAAGGLCLPVHNYVFSKRNLSTFHDWADLGAFVQFGLVLIAVGLVAFGLSFLVLGEISD
jgi:sugar phosphate permease